MATSRTVFVVAALLGVFGTGCGGCVDEKSSPPPPSGPVSTSPRKVTHVRLQLDAGPGLEAPAGDP